MASAIVVAGDLHLGRRTAGLPADVRSEVRSTRGVWRQLVEETLRREADMLVLTGDVVDEANQYFEAFAPLRDGFVRLEEAGTEVYLVTGNHDYDVLPELVGEIGASNVHLLGAGGSWESRDVEAGDLTLQLYGWSYPEKHVNWNPVNDLEIADSVDGPVLGMVHGDLGVSDSMYAPISAETLEQRSVDLWLLGHQHGRQNRAETGFTALYPGSPQPLDAGEPGAHGGMVVTVGPETVQQIRPLTLAPVRFERIEAAIEGVDTRSRWYQAIIEALREWIDHHESELGEVEILVADVEVTGRTAIYEQVDEWCQNPSDERFDDEISGIRTVVRQIHNRSRPAIGDLDQLAQEQSPAGVTAHLIRQLEDGDESEFGDDLLEEVGRELDRLANSPTYHRLEDRFPVSTDPESVKERVLQEARGLLEVLMRQREEE